MSGMSGKIIPALAAAVLLGATVLASAEPKNDAYKGANAAPRSERAAKADRMERRRGINESAQYGDRWNGDRWSERDAGGPAANQRSYFDAAPLALGPTYYDMVPGGVPPNAPGGYCEYVNHYYDVYGDNC
jgi:hypothetical protein